VTFGSMARPQTAFPLSSEPGPQAHHQVEASSALPSGRLPGESTSAQGYILVDERPPGHSARGSERTLTFRLFRRMPPWARNCPPHRCSGPQRL